MLNQLQRWCLWKELWKPISEASRKQTTLLEAGGSAMAFLVCYIGY